MAHLLSKSTFIRGQQCQKSLYLNKKRPFLRDKISAEQLAKFKRGTDVGILAQQLFPGGIDCQPKSPAQYAAKVAETASAINNPTTQVIYEAVFEYDAVLVILDVLVKEGNTWHAFEVKSSKKISETYLQDAALQYYVIENSGVPLHDFCLIYINENYQLEDTLDLEKLFKKESVLAEVRLRKALIAGAIKQSKETLELENAPKIETGQHCLNPYPCDFMGHCWKNTPKKGTMMLDAFSWEERLNWRTQGKILVDELPFSDDWSIAQQLQWKAFSSGTFVWNEGNNPAKAIDQTYGKKLAFVQVLMHQPAVPIIRKTYPYQALPLAVSTMHHNHIQNIMFTQDENGMCHFAEMMAQLLEQYHVVTLNQNILEAMINTVRLVCNHSLASGEATLTGLEELMTEMAMNFPQPLAGLTWNDVVFYLTGEQPKLKNEIWMIKDLLQKDDVQANTIALENLAKYPTTFEGVFRKLASL